MGIKSHPGLFLSFRKVDSMGVGGIKKGVTAETHESYKNAVRKPKLDPKMSFTEAMNEIGINTVSYFSVFFRNTWRDYRIAMNEGSEKKQHEMWGKVQKLLDTMVKYSFYTPKNPEEVDTGKDVHNWTFVVGDQKSDDHLPQIVSKDKKHSINIIDHQEGGLLQ